MVLTRCLSKVLTSLVTMSLMVFSDSFAMTEYAKKFKMTCSFCHAKIPALNEFGASFLKDNPTPLAMRLANKAVNGKQLKEVGERNTDDSLFENHTTATSNAKLNKMPVKSPSGTSVYRAVDGNGKLVFCDNPLNLPLKPRYTSKLRKPTAVKKPSAGKQSVSGAKANINQVARTDVPTPHAISYEKCVEAILLKSSPPTSADEAMKNLIEAENNCIRYSGAN